MISRYLQEKEIKDRKDEEKKLKKKAREQEKIKNTLD
jgi:hypothetical protein